MEVAVLMDDPTQALVAEQALTLAGHRCTRFRDGIALMIGLRAREFGAVVVDGAACSVGAHHVLRWIRRALGNRLPLLLVGDAATEAVAVCPALRDGADAWIGKPLRRRELVARIEALLRMPPPSRVSSDIAIGAFRVVPAERRIYVHGTAVPLAPKEFDLAALLFSQVGEIVLRKTLVQSVWRRCISEDSRTVDSHLSRIRIKLSLWPHNGVCLSSVYKLGVRLDRVKPGYPPVARRKARSAARALPASNRPPVSRP